MKEKLRVLVVDDSAHNRRAIADMLDSHPDIEVVGMADDGEKALKAASVLKPDLITLDLEMPRMDGFTFLRIVMSQMPTPIIVVSSENRKQSVFQVLELGALDFIAKPSRYFATDEKILREEIITKALAVQALQRTPFARRGMHAATPQEPRHATPQPQALPEPASREVNRLVCIGASTGGPPALQSIFRALPLHANTAFVVAQHMPEKFTKAFAERLNRLSSLNIQESRDGVELMGGCVYIAPGGMHMEVLRGRSGGLGGRGGGRGGGGTTAVVSVTKATSHDRYIPSIDRLFDSAAESFADKVMAVVLTGMGSDGSQGIRKVRDNGGRTIAESQETAIVFGMPKEAIQTGCVDESLPLEGIVKRVLAFSGGD